MASPRICVIGAGVSGVSSALRLLETFPGADVLIIADKFSPNTTSDVSGGFWEPHLLGDTPEKLIRTWSQETFDYVIKLAGSPDAGKIGASLMSGYCVSDKPNEDPFWKDMVFGYRRLDQRELDLYPGMTWGAFYTTNGLDVKLYLPWLMNKFVTRGGKMIQRRVNDINEVCKAGFDIIVNCTGSGARDLVGDTKVTAVRGQVMRVQAPWIHQFLIVLEGEKCGYILPGGRYVVMGGTEAYGDWNRDSRLEDKTFIRDICSKYVPSLKDVRADVDEAGLRPARTEVRLEREIIQVDGKSQNIIHNYGHGGSGVTLHWGCAGHVTRLARDILDPEKRVSKL